MVFNPAQIFFPKRFLGIDIGTSRIKIVEISKSAKRRKLENYGYLSASVLYEKSFRTFEESTLLLSSQNISRAISAIISEAKIKSRQAIFSIPDFSSFFTNFNLPPMTKEELPEAVKFEARQHIPLPLAEVVLDWQIIEGAPGNQSPIKVLLVAVPNEVINQYQEIAKLSQLQLFGLEAEVFSLLRSLVEKEEKTIISIIDIGAQSTTCSIIDRKNLVSSNSFDMSGNNLTDIIARSHNIEYLEAENLKKKYGILEQNEMPKIREILLPLIDVVIREIEVALNNFTSQSGKQIAKVILAGESALMPGLKEYFNENLGKEVEIANPFASLFYPPVLDKELKKIGPGFTIAVGLALKGLEY